MMNSKNVSKFSCNTSKKVNRVQPNCLQSYIPCIYNNRKKLLKCICKKLAIHSPRTNAAFMETMEFYVMVILNRISMGQLSEKANNNEKVLIYVSAK